MKKGSLYIISAPSGTGKTSLVKALVESLPNTQVSISHTTRDIRPGEINNIHYHFVNQAQFKAMIAEGGFIEYAEVYGNYYGTSRQWVEEHLNQGIDVILEIEWQGARQVREAFPEVVTIFILPPNKTALEERLRSRGQDTENVIQRRLAEASQEVEYCTEYDYLVINDQFEMALSDLRSILKAEHCRRKKQWLLFKRLVSELTV